MRKISSLVIFHYMIVFNVSLTIFNSVLKCVDKKRTNLIKNQSDTSIFWPIFFFNLLELNCSSG